MLYIYLYGLWSAFIAIYAVTVAHRMLVYRMRKMVNALYGILLLIVLIVPVIGMFPPYNLLLVVFILLLDYGLIKI